MNWSKLQNNSVTLSVAPLPKDRKRTSTATEAVKRRRCTKGEEGEPLGLLSQRRAKFLSLINGMIRDCGSEVECLTKDLAVSQETLRRTEATLKTIEGTHAAEMSQLEVRISDLERDLGKTVRSLLKMKKEKRTKASEVRRLQRQIQSQEESRAYEPVETTDPRAEFHARLSRMAILTNESRKIKKKFARNWISQGILYRRSFSGPYLRCVTPREASRILIGLHEGDYGSNSSSKSLVLRVKRAGYYWPTMAGDADRKAKHCDECQRHAPVS
ncbi:hypothetical protein Bca4012_063397 [Brassica carinata]